MKPTPNRIARHVYRMNHVTAQQIAEKSRAANVLASRIVIAGLCREMTNCSPTEIGLQAFGCVSHHAVNDRVRRWNLLDERTRDGWRWRVSTALKYWHSPDGLGGELASKAREELAVQR